MNKMSTLDVQNKKSEEGSILLSVVIVFLFLIIVLTTSSAMAFSNYEKSHKENDFHSAYYLAEAGINEYTDEMNDYFSSLNTPEIRKLLKLDITEFAAYLETELNTRVRNQVTLDKKNADLKFTFESIDEVSDEFVLVSSATLGGETRVVKQTLKDVRASLENNGKNNLNFLQKYGLVVKNKAEFVHTTVQGSLFLMEDNIDNIKKNISFSGNVKLKDYKDKESYIYHPTDKTVEEYKKILDKGGWYSLPEKHKKRIKGQESIINEPVFEFPQKPKGNSVLSSTMFEKNKDQNNENYNLSENGKSLTWKRGVDTLSLKEKVYRLDKLHVNFHDKRAGSQLFVDVGDKDVHMIVKDLKIDGSLIVKGEGTLTLYTDADNPVYTEDFYKLEAFDFKHATNERNGLVLIVEGEKEFKISFKEQGAYLSATFIGNYISANMGRSARASFNIISLGKNSERGNKIKILHYTVEHGELENDPRRIFIFAPYTKMTAERVSINGFIYVNEFYNKEASSTIRHDPDILNSLPPTVLDILSQLQTDDNKNPIPGTGGAFDSKVIDYGPIREVE